jgi:hypothetical protein
MSARGKGCVMLEDEQLRQLLLVNGVCDMATITRLGAEATRSNRTLYDLVVARGVVPEAQLIQMVGAVLGVGAVLLKDFQGDAMLMSLAPVDLLKREGMLPVGIQEVEGRRSLIVAMANPWSGSALQSLRKFTSLPVVPMLAGPLDLLAAIERCERNYLGGADDDVIENAELMEEDSQLTAGLRFTRDHELALSGDNPAFDELMNGFSASHPSGVMSALSIIDDIPRDRHSAATPPDGHAVVPALANDRIAPAPPVPAPRAPRSMGLSDLFPAVGSMVREAADGANRQTVEFEPDQILRNAATHGGPPAVSVSGLGGNSAVGGLMTGTETFGDAQRAVGGRPSQVASGLFMRVARAAAADRGDAQDEERATLDAIASHPRLAVALFRLLHRRGLISVAEVRAELDRLKN